ncbi:hypothetical protein ACJW8F_10180 [Plesiomonas shigelloides]|uniref:hypothetical protein n=1 Tax=Plesiomonas shigelloides TaxID=703 RepID=UPI00387EFAB3
MFVISLSLIKYIFLQIGLMSPESLDYYRQWSEFPIVIRGFFNEPSHFIIFVSSLLLAKFLILKNRVSENKFLVLVVVISFSLSMSLAGFALLLLLGVIYCLVNMKYSLVAIVFVLLLSSSVLIKYSAEFIDVEQVRLIFNRVDSLISGKDGSSNYRLFDTWNFMSYLKDEPEFLLFGVGIGNMENHFLSHTGIANYAGVNVFSNIMYFGGLTLTFVFICIMLYLLKFKLLVVLYFSLICFTHGYITGPFLFPMLAIYRGLNIRA